MAVTVAYSLLVLPRSLSEFGRLRRQEFSEIDETVVMGDRIGEVKLREPFKIAEPFARVINDFVLPPSLNKSFAESLAAFNPSIAFLS